MASARTFTCSASSSCETPSTRRAAKLSFVNAPKPARAADVDPVLAAFDNAPEEPLTDAERIAFAEAMADPGAGVSSEELLQRLRPKT